MNSLPERGIRVMLVDAHRIMLSGLRRLINDEKPHLGVVAEANDCQRAVELAAATQPDVVVVDADIAIENEASLVCNLTGTGKIRVLILSSTQDQRHELAILNGASGVVHKAESPERLITAIKKVHEGQLWLDRSTTGRLFVELSRRQSREAADPAKRKLASLTEREHDVVRTLVKQPGADNKTLATTLHIGEHTLRNHLSRIYDKLEIPNRVELFVFAQRHVEQRRAL